MIFRGLTNFFVFVILSAASVVYGQNAEDDCCEYTGGSYIFKDTLLWKGCRSGLDFAVEGHTVPPALQQGHMHDLSFAWNAGLRVALGHHLTCDHWDLRVEYTRFHTKAVETIVDDNTITQPNFFATRFHPALLLPPGQFREASGRLDIGYDVIDVMLGHHFCPCCSFELRPYAGARLLILKQDLTLHYRGADFNEDEILGGHDDIYWDSDYKAFGIHGGCQWHYYLCNDFSVYGGVGGSVVVGDPDDHLLQTTTRGTPTPLDDGELDLIESDRCLVSCGYDAALGVIWECCYDRFLIACSIGYELQQWHNVPEMRHFTSDTWYGLSYGTQRATLGFHGLVFRTRVDF